MTLEQRRAKDKRRYARDDVREKKKKYQREWRLRFKEEFGVGAHKMYGYIKDLRISARRTATDNGSINPKTVVRSVLDASPMQ